MKRIFDYLSVTRSKKSGHLNKIPEYVRDRHNHFWIIFTILVVSGCVHAEKSNAAVVITELMASNVSTYPDHHDFDDYSDWIEIWNNSSSSVNLHDYFLTDNPQNPVKWRFPDGPDSVMGPGAYLVVRADGFDRGPGDEDIREYSPWQKFQALYFHTNFRLSSEGESLSLYRLALPAESLMVIESGGEWRYLDVDHGPETNWTTMEYDDQEWKSGPSPLGYGNNSESTVIEYGSSSRNKFPTAYFRKSFELDELTGLQGGVMRCQVDDGAVIYLNGIEIQRLRIPDGPVDFNTLATAPASENLWESFDIPMNLLRTGTNILTAEVHQSSRSSSDLRFDLELTFEKSSGQPQLVDHIEFGQQYPDISWSRSQADPNTWGFSTEPTPGAPNKPPILSELEDCDSVHAEPAAGFFDQSIMVKLVPGTTLQSGVEIHYTLDGSIPGGDSTVYENPIEIQTTTVIRARAFESGKIPGPVLTSTYFINEEASGLPSISLSVEPDEYFDDKKGIFRNAHKGRETAVHLEYFDKERMSGFSVGAGTRIAGENIWRFDQKPLTVYMRGKYGDDQINWQLFPDSRIGSFGQISLRNGGDNWPNAMLRDAMTPHILRGQSHNDVQNYTPCTLYINGEFYGIYNIRERMDDVYFFNNYGLNAGTYDYLEYGHIPGNIVALIVDEGDSSAYDELLLYIENNDLTDDAHFAHVAGLVNTESLIDYIAVEDFVYNSSWRHNREFWRERKNGAKWNWVIPDLDRGFNINNIQSSLIDNLQDGYPLVKAMLDNESFRNKTAQRYAAHLASTFHPDRIAEIVDRLAAETDSAIDRHIDRWRSSGGIQSRTSRQAELDEIKEFAQRRKPEVFRGIRDHLGISDRILVSLDIDSPEGGDIYVEGVPFLPEYSDQLEMFSGIPIQLSARPGPGYEFKGWTSTADGNFQPDLNLTMESLNDIRIQCGFTRTSGRVLETTILEDTYLDESMGPVAVQGTVVIPEGVSLVVEAGSKLAMYQNAGFVVEGTLRIEGNENRPVLIDPAFTHEKWGAIIAAGSTGRVQISHAVIRGGGLGPDPVRHKGALTNIGGTLLLDHVDIQSDTTIFALGGHTELRKSFIYSPLTGDGINIKYGTGLVEDCRFQGNAAPDTDAVDFDGVTGGIIRNNVIYNFRGPNSDGIDVGENCVGLQVTGNRIFHCTDKGISVGQASEVDIINNLIVNCALGVGIKDFGSLARIDKNSFIRCTTGVAVYEKNLRAGGGQAIISNSIFFRSREAAVSQDALSELTATYTLSDNFPVDGPGNLLLDPLFVDPAVYNFELQSESPAIDAGGPESASEPDGSRVDIGASYTYNPDDYPFFKPGLIVINEVLAHSDGDKPDWIELHNTSLSPVNIGGWFLSDNDTNLGKFRIDDSTAIPALGYLVFSEDIHFGASSQSPGVFEAFALSENGETVYLSSPESLELNDWLESENFGPSATDVTKGRYLKPVTGTYNFVAMSMPTPGAPNSQPLVGPIVISEIMYHPPGNDAPEYIELLNISNDTVVLYDDQRSLGWKITDGVEFEFPADSPVAMAPGERILLVSDDELARNAWDIPDGVSVFQWTGGALDNNSERIEISRPGDVDETGNQYYIRIDRIVYEDGGFWPAQADGGGMSLTRISNSEYGNTPSNWKASPPSPGTETPQLTDEFFTWIREYDIPESKSGWLDNPDGDTFSNLMEFIAGTSPVEKNQGTFLKISQSARQIAIEFQISKRASIAGYSLELQKGTSVNTQDWEPVTDLPRIPVDQNSEIFRFVSDPLLDGGQATFFRLNILTPDTFPDN